MQIREYYRKLSDRGAESKLFSQQRSSVVMFDAVLNAHLQLGTDGFGRGIGLHKQNSSAATSIFLRQCTFFLSHGVNGTDCDCDTGVDVRGMQNAVTLA